MKNWWRIPATQDAEYDEYDYYYTELPKNEVKWEWYYKKCDSCGKYHRLNFYSNQWFYTMDGGDSLDYTSCWKCELGDMICGVKNKIKKEIEAHKLAFSLLNRKHSIKRNIEHYKLGLKIARS